MAKHFDDNGNEIRCVYLAMFEQDWYCYVGPANDYDRRIGDHLFNDRHSEVFQHKRHTGFIPEFTMLHDYTSIEEADKLEYYYTIEYAKLGTEVRQKITYDELPQVLIDALIATEDSRFFQHNGFDAPRFVKAAIGQVLGKADAGGGSTITMQVVKNSFSVEADGTIASSGIKGITRKFQDIYLSIFKLERSCTKEKIIEYYVNNHYLGGNIYGVEEASEAYFGKSVSDINLSEAAILAGMFKSPAYYRPTAYPEHAASRRATVLYLMKRHGYITEEEEKILKQIENKPSIIVINKIDLDCKLTLPKVNKDIIKISIKEGTGIAKLKDTIKKIYNLEEIEVKDLTYLSDARSISLLKKSLEKIEDAINNIKNTSPIDMVELDLKNSWELLGKIIGETYTDELIDELFSRFCLGK